MVELNLSIIMLPLIISGVSFGVLLNAMMPSIIIVIVYVTVLSYLGIGVLKKAIIIYKREEI